jgi:poly-beta-1,6-N-acetyl-D-glucosamine synthase
MKAAVPVTINHMPAKYVIITPVRDEERFIESTIRCVVSQTNQPAQWIIVDDGSRDLTGSIIDRYASQFPWIRVRHRKDRGFRKSGSGVMEAFQDGYKSLTSRKWDFLVKLDGDLSFDDDYFERLFARFHANPRLGISGGTVYHIVNGVKQIEDGPRFHVRGATKVYRQECWEAIGGLHEAPGWDTVDEVHANMLGWMTESYPDIQVVHHRFTGTAESLWKDMVKGGRACYFSGYHPIFMTAKCIYRLAHPPYIIGSLGMIWGFVTGYLKRLPRVENPPLMRYLRDQQLARLLGRETIWK